MTYDEDLKRLARNYVRRQCDYMDICPTETEENRAALKVYRAIAEIRNARAALARSLKRLAASRIRAARR